MNTVYKYIIDPYTPGIELPKNAEVLSVAFQRDEFCMWVKVDTEAEKETRSFVAFGTGHMDNGLVFHAFELSL